jgi:alpha-L-rhamnosidase
VQGDTDNEKAVNTNNTWKVYNNKAYTPCSLDNGPRLRSYMVVGPGDHVKAAAYPWGWEQPGYNDNSWPAAVAITHPVPAGYGTDNLWTLIPRSIPLMEESPQH